MLSADHYPILNLSSDAVSPGRNKRGNLQPVIPMDADETVLETEEEVDEYAEQLWNSVSAELDGLMKPPYRMQTRHEFIDATNNFTGKTKQEREAHIDMVLGVFKTFYDETIQPLIVANAVSGARQKTVAKKKLQNLEKNLLKHEPSPIVKSVSQVAQEQTQTPKRRRM